MVLMESHHTEQYVSSPAAPDQAAETSACPNSTNKKTPIRTCIVTRDEADKSDLLRFVCNKDGALFFDLNQKLPGRGIYISPDREHLEKAIQKGLFARSAKRKVTVPDDLLNRVTETLRQSVLNYIGLARRAGDLIISLEKIDKYIKNNKIACYITSSSEKSDGYRKIGSKIDRDLIITEFSNEELSQTLKLENAVHLAIKEGELAQAFLKQFKTYQKLSKQ